MGLEAKDVEDITLAWRNTTAAAMRAVITLTEFVQHRSFVAQIHSAVSSFRRSDIITVEYWMCS
jgi:hypothetical protein